jgi:hypothetical protein
MKKLSITLFVFIMSAMPLFTNAQTAIDGLYQKYAGKEGFTSINISPQMFQMLSGINMKDSSKEALQAQEAIKQLKGLKMLVYEPKDSTKALDFYNEIKKTVPMKAYSELMTVDGQDGKVKFLASQDSNGKIKELLMIVSGSDETLIMSLTGLIDMQTISEISNSINVQGMSNLQKLKDNHEKK